MMRIRFLLPLFFLLPVLVPASAEAQIRVLPSLGLYAPLSDLSDAYDQEGNRIIEAGRRSSTLALGLGAEVGPPSGTGLRIQLGYATDSSVPLTAVGCPDCELRSTLLTGTAALVFRPMPSGLVVHPHLLVGAGLKRYGFDRSDLREEGYDQVFRNQTQFAGHLGVGTTVFLGFASPLVELSAYVSRIDGVEGNGLTADDELQTDLFLTVSIPFGR